MLLPVGRWNSHRVSYSNFSFGVLSRTVLWTARRGCNGLSNKSHCGKCKYGRIWNKSHQFNTSSPYLWKRFVDDTFTIIKSSEKTRFLKHLNTIDPNIQFTSEECRIDGSMPFLDILITLKEDGSLSTTVYRKPTHTDVYLQWDNNHAISSKYSVVGSLHHRAKTICSCHELLQQEEDHLKQALTRY